MGLVLVMVELGSSQSELFYDLEMLGSEIVCVALVVDEWCGHIEEEFLWAVELVHAWSDFANFVRQLWLLHCELILSINNSHDRFRVALDVKHYMVLKNVQINQRLFSMQCVNYLLGFLVVLSD